MENFDFLTFDDVSFVYPAVEGDIDSDGNQIEPSPVFEHFSANLPRGFVSLVGQNGCGKSTLLLLASGRIEPTAGSVSLLGQRLFGMDENQKNLLATVIYQNMEFESEDLVENLLSFVYENGKFGAKSNAILKDGDLLDEVLDVFELENLKNHSLTHLSKGEIQRVLLAFSILYGSDSIFMDEPMFAMEERQKEIALDYIQKMVHKTGRTVYIAMHELDLTRKFADYVLLIRTDRSMILGSADEVLTDDELEKAYGIPASMLKKKEDLTREQLKNESDFLSKD